MDRQQPYLNLFSLSALLCLLLLMAGNAFALDEIDGLEDELLEPDKAFAIDISSVDDSTLQVTWDIADGYYMYRDRIRFSTDTPGMELGEPSLPAGKIKDDEFFGKIAVFRNQVTATIPVTRSGTIGFQVENALAATAAAWALDLNWEVIEAGLADVVVPWKGARAALDRLGVD